MEMLSKKPNQLSLADAAQARGAWEAYMAPGWETGAVHECLPWSGSIRYSHGNHANSLPCLIIGSQRFSMRQIISIHSGQINATTASTARISMRCGNAACLNSRHMIITPVMSFQRSNTNTASRKRPYATCVGGGSDLGREDDGTLSSSSMDAMSVTSSSNYSMAGLSSCDETTNDALFDDIRPSATASPSSDGMEESLYPPMKRARIDTDESVLAQFG